MKSEESAHRPQHRNQRTGDPTSRVISEDTAEDLPQAYEELRVAAEELRQQNEELARAHRQLDVERCRYRELFELAPDAYLITNLAGVIEEANQSASTLLSAPAQFLTGKLIASCIAAEDRPRFRALLSEAARGGAALTTLFRLRSRGGRAPWAELTHSVARDSGGKPVGFRWLVRDVTEQERLGRQIRTLNAELESRVADRTADLQAAQQLSDELLRREQAARHAAEASEAQSRHVQKLGSIGVLAGGIAHDFNNLLHVVLGNADIALSRLRPDASAREPMEEVIRATLRAADLTRQLLAYSGKGAFIVSRLDLSDEVREMATLLRTAISKQANLRWELATDLPAVRADPTQIRQVVMNLITNASDALGEEGGTITLRTGVVRSDELTQNHFGFPPRGENPVEPAPGCYVYLEIADTGAGMTPDTLSRIFDPFFSTKFAGRGLGLAAAMGIVQAHRGLIRIRTDPGAGTSFRVLFPPVTGPPHQEEPPPERSDWRGEGTVLVVDDEEGVREVAERMLQDIGFQTVPAADGRQALEIVDRSAGAINSVLLDLSMPNLGGQETLEHLRRRRPDLPVVIMSGYSEQAVAQQLRDSEPAITGFLQKPFLPEDLTTAFRRFAEIQA